MPPPGDFGIKPNAVLPERDRSFRRVKVCSHV
jgi:hypothetical protein